MGMEHTIHRSILSTLHLSTTHSAPYWSLLHFAQGTRFLHALDYLPPESPVFATRSVVTSTNSRSPIVPPPSRPDTTADSHTSHLPKFHECSQGTFRLFEVQCTGRNRQKGLKWRRWRVPMPDCLTPPNGVAPGLEPGWALTPRTPDWILEAISAPLSRSFVPTHPYKHVHSRGTLEKPKFAVFSRGKAEEGQRQ